MPTHRIASLAGGRVWLDLAGDELDGGEFRVSGAAWANDTDDPVWAAIYTSTGNREAVAHEEIPPRSSGERNVTGNPQRRTDPVIALSWERGR